MKHPTPDDPRDAHLLAALRHAPDRDVAPPAQLSAAILSQAQQALRGRPSAPTGGWRAAWAWLWRPAPMAAFGTLAMASLIGVMWRVQEMPEATPSLRPDVVAMAPAKPAAEVPPTASAAPAVAPERLAVERDTAERSAALRQPAERSPALARARLGAEANSASAVTRGSVDTNAAEPEARQAAAASSAAETLALAPPMPAPVVSPATTHEADGRRDALAKSTLDAARADARARNEMAVAAQALPHALSTARAVAASPLKAVDIANAMAGDGTRVRWRMAAGRELGHEAAQRQWWLALVDSTQGRWQLATGASDRSGAAAPLTLLIDGTPRGTLSFEPQALLWRDASGAAWRAPIEPKPLREWQEAIARW